MTVPEFLEARRSIRAFVAEPVPRAVLDGAVEAACIAPAPHHSRPWRWVVVDTADAKQRLADGMGERWRRDLEGDAVAPERVDALVRASHEKITSAPALVLGCLTWEGLDRYPDEGRRRAEWGMALLSLGAAVENLMLATAVCRLCVLLGRRADLLPGGRRATPSISPANGCPMRWFSSGVLIRRTSAVPAPPYPSTTSAPTADPRPARHATGVNPGCQRPVADASSGVAVVGLSGRGRGTIRG